MAVDLHLGDCLDVLKTLPDNSVDAVVTDPPYELGFMGKKWDSTGIAYNVNVWRECLRVLKPGGHLLAFGGSRTYHRMAVAIEDAGFEVRDQIMWLYGSGFPKSHNLEGQWDGWGTALKPAHEPICVARKPIAENTVAKNVLAWGTGAVNVDGGRVKITEKLPRYQTPGGIGGDHTYSGGWSRSNKMDHPESVRHDSQGRWPANVIHDGSEEVVAGFPKSTSIEKRRANLNQGANTGIFTTHKKGDFTPSYPDGGGSVARFFYCAKASQKDRDEGLEGFNERLGTNSSMTTRGEQERGEHRSESAGSRNHHPTVKPTSLMRYLCRLVTPPGGVILDPFTGSGSTGKGAVLEGFSFIGIEREAEYLAIARARIAAAQGEPKQESILCGQ